MLYNMYKSLKQTVDINLRYSECTYYILIMKSVILLIDQFVKTFDYTLLHYIIYLLFSYITISAI